MEILIQNLVDLEITGCGRGETLADRGGEKNGREYQTSNRAGPLRSA